MVAPEGHHTAVVLHVWREKGWLGLLQDIQGGHLRGGQAIVFHIRAHRMEFSEVVERGRLGMAWVAHVACRTVAHTKVVTARLGEVVEEDVGLHPLDLLGLLLSPGTVLVVGVILQVLDPQSLCLLHKGALVIRTEAFP